MAGALNASPRCSPGAAASELADEPGSASPAGMRTLVECVREHKSNSGTCLCPRSASGWEDVNAEAVRPEITDSLRGGLDPSLIQFSWTPTSVFRC